MTFSFEKMADSGLIVVAVTLDGKGKLWMILDRGCSNTTIDNKMHCIYWDMSWRML